MFTIIWHYEGDGLGSFRQATFENYADALKALRTTTSNIPAGQPVPVSAMLVGATGYVFDFVATIADYELIER